MFTIHWKHLSSKPLHASPSFDSSSYLNGWFKDYLWFNSSALIRGYDISGSNSLFPYSWLFLGAHLLWATSFMFLISWRGYLARRTYRHLILHAHPNSILILTLGAYECHSDSSLNNASQAHRRNTLRLWLHSNLCRFHHQNFKLTSLS